MTRPVLVVMVHNAITGDSRVVKTALTAARAGWDVTLLGWARKRGRTESRIGPVKVLRVPLTRTMHDRFERVGRTSDESASRGSRRFVSFLTHKTSVSRARGAEPTDREVGVLWRRDWPVLDDWWLSYRRELRQLAPDVIHANDVQMIGVAARYCEEVRLRGGTCAWLYDSHEFVPAIDWGGERTSEAFRQHEAEFIHRADAVVTVSARIAEMIQARHGLPARPKVVANAPVAGVPATGVSVREVCGLPEETPLLVYSGRVAHARGVQTVVAALEFLPGVHLAVVCSGTGADLESLIGLAAATRVADRVHTVPYVDAVHVPAYLSSADVGLAPFLRRPNHEESLPTKVPEYLHAGLPIVASDMRAMEHFLAETGTGVTFEAESVAGCATAIRTALANREALGASITFDLLAEHSWQRQATTLVETYRRISGIDPEPVDAPWDAIEVATTL